MEIQIFKKPDKNGQWRGGGREGAGRKVFDQNCEDRRILSMWLCDWFTRQYFIVMRSKLSDARAEKEVNDYSTEGAVFNEEPATNVGKMWNAAKRGERPFSLDRLGAIASAADKLKLVAFGRVKGAKYEDRITACTLMMLAEDGFTDFLKIKKEFLARQKDLFHCLHKLATTKEAKFEHIKNDAILKISEFESFTEAIPYMAGYVSIRPDLEASFQDQEDIRRLKLKPKAAIKLIAKLRCDSDLSVLDLIIKQVWSLYLERELDSNINVSVTHAKKAIKQKPKAGTKLAQ